MALSKRKNAFQKKCLLLFVFTCCIYVLGTLCLNSIESAINIEVQRVEAQIENQSSVLDGLNTACHEKVNFDNIMEVAQAKGYELGFATTQIAANQ